MDDTIRCNFAPYLDPEEALLWAGRAKPGVTFRLSDLISIPFFILFALLPFGVAYALANKDGEAVPATLAVVLLLTSPWTLTALYQIAGRFVHEWWYRKHLRYAITDNRAIILSGRDGQKVVSIDLVTLQQLRLVEARSGDGIIYFEDASAVHKDRMRGAQGPLRGPPQFFKPGKAKDVFRLLQKTAQQLKPSGNYERPAAKSQAVPLLVKKAPRSFAEWMFGVAGKHDEAQRLCAGKSRTASEWLVGK